ncbi:15-cis-phytoene/all-trans-phytoene synthase [Novimethylophilus kurashikiensis]|uniref:15-cis-phytoene/all-trans-phytoene synthase n=1 Tax=Novimethylophilus kurashikiensis TaxID=1825523 RepID=A0A2R5F357_9PROT|nr:presqualene diphosphate synthase HpnD [Novimethylophilus kurashikiensis]GBG12980.1 15-cis-phytoene/all-trans-phytoene synthase [Novimethylophilus kurashikiensis]
MTPQQYCQDKAAASGSSFYYSFLFLPKPRREAITALYAFCREVDDVADECSDINLARTKLAWWRQEVGNLYAGNPQHPVTQALESAVRDYGLDEEHLLEIIDGMEMDLDQNRYADFKELQLYCYRVASVVGLLSAAIFGYTDRKTLKYAHDLGMAFQLTNIIRDVGEDARRGRIYLPTDELQQFSVSEIDILHGHETENVRKLLQFQIARAQEFYDKAFAELPAVDRRAQRPGLMMAAIYRTVLDEIADGDCEKVLNQRISLTPLRKLWLAWKTWIAG